MPELTKRCKHEIQSFMSEPDSLRRLLAHSIDYAGLFPPCSLELSAALANQAEYVRSDDSWMLSTFVLPVARFKEAAAGFDRFGRDHPLRLSALGPGKATAGEFRDELKLVAQEIAALKSVENPVHVEQLEMALPKEGLDVIPEIARIVEPLGLPTFWEAPADKAPLAIARLAETNEALGEHRLGFKLRTGGVQADAFPAANKIAKALVAAVRHRVPIKFTAGLHHPIRQFRPEVKAKMYGFLNVLGAGIVAAEHQLEPDELVPLLESEDIGQFSFESSGFKWRNWEVPTDRVEKHRQLITSFGSCSFNEPREDLRECGLM